MDTSAQINVASRDVARFHGQKFPMSRFVYRDNKFVTFHSIICVQGKYFSVGTTNTLNTDQTRRTAGVDRRC